MNGRRSTPGSLPLRLLVLGVLSGPFPALSAVFEVDRTDDTAAAGAQVCSAAANDCSLRGAILKANATPGADTLTFATSTNGTPITLSIANVGGTNEDTGAAGDLDVTDSLTIAGNGAANTIVQAGTNATNGIDKVFAINPICDHAVAFTVTGVTIRYGRNAQPWGAGDFSYTGGGLDWCGFGASSLTMQNVVVSDNTNVNGYGGGINVDEVAPAAGTVSITGSTIQNNTSGAWGGGLNVFGDEVQVTIAGSTIQNNTTLASGGNGGAGGGINLRITHQTGARVPFLVVDSTTISGNTARGYGGGICVAGSGKQDVTLRNGTLVTGNTVTADQAISSVGGGLYVAADAARTNSISNTTISGNHADVLGSGGSPENPEGGGILVDAGVVTLGAGTVVTGNTSVDGAGIFVRTATSTLNATGTTISSNLAKNNGGGVGILAGSATLDGVTLRGNAADSDASGAGDGGGIYRAGGALTLANVIAIGGAAAGQGNSARNGGGIANAAGTLTLTSTGSTIVGNQATGNGGGVHVPGGTVTVNGLQVTGNSAGGSGGAFAVAGGTLSASRNRVAGNTAGTAAGAFRSSGTAAVTNDWWGCSSDPTAGGTPCNAVGGTSATPWLRVLLTPGSAALATNQTTGLTASVNTNSAGTDVTGTVGVLLGLPVTWSGSLGSISGAQATVQLSGTAIATFTATAVGAASAAAIVDGDASSGVRSNVAAITVGKAGTTAAITGQGATTSGAGVPFGVSYGVTGAFGNAPTAPTGNVLVSDGVDSCTATVAAGSCQLALSTLGTRTITATYQGDASFDASPASAGASHTVVPGPASSFLVAAPALVTAGSAFNVTVTAKDQFGNTATGYAGTVHFTSSDGAAALPADGTLTNGAGTFGVTLNTTGSRSVTATDTVSSSVTGTSGAIAVASAGPAALSGIVTGKGGPSNARVWTVTVTNGGPGAAYGARLDSLALTQTAGPACTPVAGTALPVGFGDLGPSASASRNVTIDFAGCALNAQFRAVLGFSANAGADTGSRTLHHQFQ